MTQPWRHRSWVGPAGPTSTVRAVDTARLLAADAVQKVGNGHPGTAMSLAPVAYLLFQNVMRHDPSDSHWLGRDRFVLSCGHSSLTQYVQLYLSRLRPRAGRPQGAAHVGLQDPRPPRGPPHQRRRDHHRAARLGTGLRRRHGVRAAPPARPVRPGGRAGPEPVRPPRLRARLATATSWRACPPRPARSPATSSWATSR